MMDVKSSGFASRIALLLLLLSAIFPLSFSGANQILDTKKPSPPPPAESSVSTFVFSIRGNVYPLGHYTVNLAIGNPPKAFDLDIDSGSDLTWVQCDVPCQQCTLPKDRQYKFYTSNLVKCGDPLCKAVEPGCTAGASHCDYDADYADRGSSLGLLVQDSITLRSFDGKTQATRLAFGCGYDQAFTGDHFTIDTAGVLGLGNGPTSIVSQLKSLGLIRNVVGHCLSGKGGYIFLGDKFTQLPGLVWKPILRTSSAVLEHYMSGPADLLSNGNPTPVVKGLYLIFDSGSTYTYLNPKAYKAVVVQITNDLKTTPLTRVRDSTLAICWKGPNPFNHFKNLTLSFTKSNAQLQLPPKAYLIISKLGNACLGILDGSTEGLGNTNIIGDISLQDKLVIYDNEKHQIGWVTADCDNPPML